MTYGSRAANAMPDHHMFTNVFVNPASYRAFVGSGRWPDKTIFMLEVRHTGTDRRPNRAGLFQAEAVGLEAHVLDASKGGSRFYDFDGKSSGSPLSATSSCNTCHDEHGAVDNTFVQFYPELLTVAKAKGTIKAGFDLEAAARATESAGSGGSFRPERLGHNRRVLRADLHVHSWHSGYNHDLPFLKSRDCFADPLAVYKAAKARGMDLVAITDHDSIDGGLELLSRAPDGRDVILGEEVSCWLPVDGATGPDRRVEVHFGTWGMTEIAHRELQPLRGNALEVAAYLRAAGIFFAFNHPFHFYQGQLPLERYLELLIDAAPAIETRNGAMLPAHNHAGGGAGALPRQGRRRRQRRAHAAPRRDDVDGGARRDARGVPGQRRGGARPRRRRPRRHLPARRRHLRRHRAGTG